MDKYKTAPEDIVPAGQKIAFGAGNLTNQLLFFQFNCAGSDVVASK